MAITKRIQISEIILPLLFLIFGAVFFLESFNVTSLNFGGVNLTTTYPRFLAVLLILFSLFSIIQKVYEGVKVENKEKKESNLMKDWNKAGGRIVSFMVLLIGYVILMRYIGYFETGFFFLVFATFLLGEKTKKAFVKAVIVAAITTLVVYFVFGFMLNIYVPRGILFSY